MQTTRRKRAVRRLRVLTFTTCLVAFAARGLAAQEVTGTWVLSVEISAGSGDARFELQQRGDSITGTYSGVLGQGVRVTGMIRQDEIEFSFESEAGTITFVGKVTDTTMEGTCDYGLLGAGTFTGRKVD